MNVSTDLIDSTAEDTFTLTVLEGISFVIIESPEFSVTGEEVTFTILPHTGAHFFKYVNNAVICFSLNDFLEKDNISKVIDDRLQHQLKFLNGISIMLLFSPETCDNEIFGI